jgi:hypothetical protein
MPLLLTLAIVPHQLTHLAPVDLAILLLYFAMVIFVGFYVKGSTNTSEQFFLAGREMSAWIAGLSFVSANLGSLELMGWAGAAYQYGILAVHWYWIGAIPAMLFLGIVMMPFYYISKTHSVPGYLQLRFGEGAFTNDPLNTFGGAGVVEIPNMQALLRYICEHGFEHHVAANFSTTAAPVYEAATKYLGWPMNWHK